MASKGLEAARAQPPDVAFTNDRLLNGDGIELCRTIRNDARIGAGLPIIVTAPGPANRKDRLAALRAGAWEYLAFPVDPEELLLKLRSFLRAKREFDRVREGRLLDDLTGLYCLRGLEHRIKQIMSAAGRQKEAVVCIVLGPTLDWRSEPEAVSDTNAAVGSAALRCGEVFKGLARASDGIGRVEPLDFAVVGRGLDRDGVLRLGGRLASALRSTLEREESLGAFSVRGGFHMIPNVREAPDSPSDILVGAATAFQESKRLGIGDWIQPFRSE